MTNICQDCGMVVRTPTEYHPYAACLMFKACHDGDTVRANLEAVRSPAPLDLCMTATGRKRIDAAAEVLSKVLAFVDAPAYQDEVSRALSGLRAMQSTAPGAPGQEAVEVVAWQWRKKGTPWSLERTFYSQVYATTDDTEVRALGVIAAQEAAAVQAVGAADESKDYPFYELRFIMRVLSHKGRAPEQDWATAHGMAKEIFSKWHKDRIAAGAGEKTS